MHSRRFTPDQEMQPEAAVPPGAAPCRGPVRARRRALPALASLATLASGCASFAPAGVEFTRFGAPAVAGGTPAYCAWYGAADGSSLYFGEAAFWSAMRQAGGDPAADLGVRGPKRIGRFNLANATLSPSIPVDVSGGSGIWDVLAAGDQVFFTTYFGPGGVVDVPTGRATIFEDAGIGLNELAPGPGQTLVASRYGTADGSGGSVVLLTGDGSVLHEFPLAADEGWLAAPKTVAYDPVRRQIWVTVDLVSKAGARPRQDARRLSLEGHELARVADPEIQFVTFGRDGTGYLAERSGSRLRLLVLERRAPKGDPLLASRPIPLDDAFDADHDFAQDIQLADDGRVVVTRWSGRVHVVDPRSSHVETIDFPRDAAGGLYYTAVLASGRLCSTLCAGVEVVCTDAPVREPPPRPKKGLR